jgi:hypothetical protein
VSLEKEHDLRGEEVDGFVGDWGAAAGQKRQIRRGKLDKEGKERGRDSQRLHGKRSQIKGMWRSEAMKTTEKERQ